ncbi:hypothetical protein PIB30_099199, partial [Stylosanthes scabra]|nr:hypothetical protein [Stylosanthes scabra]
MECFITWQLEPKNSGLFGRKPIINSLLNKTNEPKKKNEETKLAEQEMKFGKKSRARTPRICVEQHAYACNIKPNPRLGKSVTLRRGNHLILSTHMRRKPHICVGNQQLKFPRSCCHNLKRDHHFTKHHSPTHMRGRRL